jgi:adenylosuccinate synthase
MKEIQYVDIVADLSWGDTGKGKITSYLAKDKSYDYVCRWAGGNNAGHTVFLKGKKFKTHLIPSGVFHGIKSIIGPQCVVHPESLQEELDYLKENGFDTSLVKVSPRAHIVTAKHISADKRKLAKKLGTTSKGIAPCYSDKMARTGQLAKDVLPEELIWNEKLSGRILCEGAQGYYLDIDHGNYPFVTSSITLPYGACSLGFPPQKIRRIWGIAKLYDTRSGVDPLFPDELLKDEELTKLGDLGGEVGVTTGRRRKCNWLNVDMMIDAARKTGTTHLVINKCDIIRELGIFKCYSGGELKEFSSYHKMTEFITDQIGQSNSLAKHIYLSNSPERL